jgi:hypothetical protein
MSIFGGVGLRLQAFWVMKAGKARNIKCGTSLSAEIVLLRMLVLKPKIHSLSPDVDCVGRDRPHLRYEFGFKDAVAPTLVAHMCMKALRRFCAEFYEGRR